MSYERLSYGIRREYGPNWFKLTLGRNKAAKAGPYKWGPPYANATFRFGRWPYFTFHAWHNNYGHYDSYIQIFGWIIGLVGVNATCDHQISTKIIPNIHKVKSYG